jgi:hypothetical protein
MYVMNGRIVDKDMIQAVQQLNEEFPAGQIKLHEYDIPPHACYTCAHRHGKVNAEGITECSFLNDGLVDCINEKYRYWQYDAQS